MIAHRLSRSMKVRASRTAPSELLHRRGRHISRLYELCSTYLAVYEEITRRTGTSQATVYCHFPSLDDLRPACARSIDVPQPLTPAQAQETF
jgi:hypothetical protein